MGTSFNLMPHLYKYEDHPHAYGDKVTVLVCVFKALGSSPRVWGQVINALEHLCSYRIIPTRMGTSKTLNYKFLHRKDHPHAYGDKFFRKIFANLIRGSSPRVWGQVFLVIAAT